MPSTFRLTSGQGQKWRQAVELLVPYDDREGELLSPEDAELFLADDRCYLLLAKEDGNAIGLLSAFKFPDVECGGYIVYLYDIEVKEDHRRRGIGKSLIKTLLALCEADEVDLIWAGTESANRAARRTFESTGAELESESYAEYAWELE